MPQKALYPDFCPTPFVWSFSSLSVATASWPLWRLPECCLAESLSVSRLAVVSTAFWQVMQKWLFGLLKPGKHQIRRALSNTRVARDAHHDLQGTSASIL